MAILLSHWLCHVSMEIGPTWPFFFPVPMHWVSRQVSRLQTEAEATDAETSLPKGPWPVVGVVGVVGWVCRILSQEFWAKAKHLMRLGKTSRSVNTFGRIQNNPKHMPYPYPIWSNYSSENDEATIFTEDLHGRFLDKSSLDLEKSLHHWTHQQVASLKSHRIQSAQERNAGWIKRDCADAKVTACDISESPLRCCPWHETVLLPSSSPVSEWSLIKYWSTNVVNHRHSALTSFEHLMILEASRHQVRWFRAPWAPSTHMIIPWLWYIFYIMMLFPVNIAILGVNSEWTLRLETWIATFNGLIFAKVNDTSFCCPQIHRRFLVCHIFSWFWQTLANLRMGSWESCNLIT